MSLIVVLLLLASMGTTACNKADTTPVQDTPTAQNVDTPDTPAVNPELAPWIIEWNPHASSWIYASVYGEATMKVYHDLIDAIESGAESVPCKDGQTFSWVFTVLHEQYPLYAPLLSDIGFDEQTGLAMLSYAMEQDERQSLIADFQLRVQEIVSECIYDDYNEVERAAALHEYLSHYFIFDHEAADSDYADVTPYRAIMTGEGICQSFTGVYTYIALQIGIDAASVSGSTPDFSFSHEWNVVTFDGVSFYLDVTFENGDGYGLRYFGITGAQREAEGGFEEEFFNIGNSNEFWGRDFPVTDERFSPLWSAVYLEGFDREDGRLVALCIDENGDPFTFSF